MKVPAVALGLAISIPLANAYTGDLTHYTPNVGSCGRVNTDSDAIVALSYLIMSPQNPGNPNNNPLCNKQISIHNPTTGTDTIATVTDTCEGCEIDSIDVTISLFNKIAPNGDGRVHGIQWTPIGWTIPGGSGESESPSSTAPTSAPPAVQPSPSPAASAIPDTQPQEKAAAVTPAAQPSPPAVTPSVAAPEPPAASPSAAQQPAGSSAPCSNAGESVCSADGTQVGICTTDLTVQFGPVAVGTKCVGGYMVMANSRLRSRRG